MEIARIVLGGLPEQELRAWRKQQIMEERLREERHQQELQ